MPCSTGMNLALLDCPRSVLGESVGRMHRARLFAVMGVIGLFVVGDSASTPSTPRRTLGSHRVRKKTLPKPGGGVWKCTFRRYEFNGKGLTGRSGCRRSTSPPVRRRPRLPPVILATTRPTTSQSGEGNLQLTVREARTPVVCNGSPSNYTSGSVSTYRKFSQQYGRFESSFKNTAAIWPGLHGGLWLWPDDRVPLTSLGLPLERSMSRDVLAVSRLGDPVPSLHVQ